MLNYRIMTDPFPLQASAETGSPIIAQLTIVATNSTSSTVNLQAITIALPVGDGANELTPDATSIRPVVPDNPVNPLPAGSSSATNPTPSTPGTNPVTHDLWWIDPEGSPYTFTAPDNYPGLGSDASLVFVFNNVEINKTPGNTVLTITEYGDQQATGTVEMDKFPNGWGTVTFGANPEIVEKNKGTTLHWSGPAGTYTIEYYTPQGGIVNVPAAGARALSNEGVYPARTDPPLSLKQDTNFYLNVTETTSSGLTYSAQQPVTVTVETPRPTVKQFTGELKLAEDNSVELRLRWETENADTCTITGDDHDLKPSSLDDSYKIMPTADNPLLLSYTLTVENAAGTVTATITLEWGEVATTIPIVMVHAPPAYIALNNARVFITFPSEHIVAVIDAKTLQPVDLPISVGASVGALPTAIAVSPENARVFVGNYGDNTVTVIDAVTLQQIGQPIPVGKGPTHVAVMPAVPPDNARVFVGNLSDNTVTVIDAVTLQQIGQPIPLGESPSGVAVRQAVPPDNALVFVTSNVNNTVTVIDAVTRQPIAGSPIPVGSGPLGIAVSPDNAHVFVVNSSDNTVTVIDAVTRQQIGQPIPVGSTPFAIAVSPDNARVFVINNDSTVTIIDAVARQQIGQPIPLGGVPFAVAVLPDNTRAFVVDQMNVYLLVIGRKVTGGTSG